jgi:hypothetical protein
MYQEQEPVYETTVEHRGGTEVKVTHPAFGAISTSRPSCGGEGKTLFGSDIGHQHYVTVTLQEATLEQDLGRDWINKGKVVAEFHLSEAQWAKFVASGGRGSATPVTLDTIRGGDELVRHPQSRRKEGTRKDQFDEEFRRKLEESLEDISSISRDLRGMSEGKVSKTELKRLASRLTAAVGNLPGNLNFAVEAFKEITETFVEDAKAEVEAYALNSLQQLGQEALSSFSSNDNKTLSGDPDA